MATLSKTDLYNKAYNLKIKVALPLEEVTELIKPVKGDSKATIVRLEKIAQKLVDINALSDGYIDRHDYFNFIDTYLKPKKAGSSVKHPPIKDDETGELLYWCRYHEEYYPMAQMVFSNGKSKGYSKAGIKRWTKARKEIEKLNDLVSKSVESGDFEKAKELSAEAKELKDNFNLPSYYRDDNNEIIL